MNIAEIIVPGRIYYFSIGLLPTDDPVNKFMIIVSKDTNPFLLVKINSQNRVFGQNHRLSEHSFKIRKVDYPFLSYDSFVDCGNVWINRLTISEIIAQVESSPKRYVGDLKSDHRNEVIRLTKQSKSVSNIHKRIVEESLHIQK